MGPSRPVMNSPSDDARDPDVTGDEWERWAAGAFARVLDARPGLTPADLAAELLRGAGADLDLDPVRVEAAVVECRRRLRHSSDRPSGDVNP